MLNLVPRRLNFVILNLEEKVKGRTALQANRRLDQSSAGAQTSCSGTR